MSSKPVTKSNGVVVRKSSIRKLPIVLIICTEVENDEYIILLKFGGRSVRGFEDIGWVLSSVPPVAGIGLIFYFVYFLASRPVMT